MHLNHYALLSERELSPEERSEILNVVGKNSGRHNIAGVAELQRVNIASFRPSDLLAAFPDAK